MDTIFANPLMPWLLLIVVLFAVVQWRKRSAVWGGATLGLIIGVIVGLFTGTFENVLRFIILGASAGVVAEILGWIGDWLRRRSDEL